MTANTDRFWGATVEAEKAADLNARVSAIEEMFEAAEAVRAEAIAHGRNRHGLRLRGFLDGMAIPRLRRMLDDSCDATAEYFVGRLAQLRIREGR